MKESDEIDPEMRERIFGIRNQLVELCGLFEGSFVVIGGWAIHAHNPRELTLDGDAMVSLETDGTLRDMFEVTPNPRMKKKQFVGKDGFDFDIYVEQQHGLRVPYSRLSALAEKKDGLTVACPEHLLVLKLDAARDRKGSGKGEKDKQDVLSLLALGTPSFKHAGELAAYLTDDDWHDLKSIVSDVNSTEQYLGGNAWSAKTFRATLSSTFGALKKAADTTGDLPSGSSPDPNPGLAKKARSLGERDI
jgi:hypothetical protein